MTILIKAREGGDYERIGQNNWPCVDGEPGHWTDELRIAWLINCSLADLALDWLQQHELWKPNPADWCSMQTTEIDPEQWPV